MKKTTLFIRSFVFARTVVSEIGMVILLALLASASRAAVWSWSGGGGANTYWNNNANWGYAGIPGNGDTVIFSASQPNLVNTNNITGLVLNQIRFVGAGGGYDIRGNAFTLTDSLVATNTSGANTIEPGITLTATDFPITVGSGAVLTLAGSLGGAAGVTKSGAGTLTYSGSAGNYYSGPTIVNGGLLQLNNSGVGINYGSLTISNATVRELQAYQLGTIPVTVLAGGLLDLNGFYDTIGYSVTLGGGGSVNTGTGGTLALAGGATSITVLSGTCNINGSGYLQLNYGLCTISVSGSTLNVYPSVQGSAGVTETGGGALFLYGANTYTGQTTVTNQSWLHAENALALGSTNSGTVVGNGSTLILEGSVNIVNEALTLNGPGPAGWGALDVENGTHTWSGPITNNADSTLDAWSSGSALHLSGPITGAGGLELFGSGSHYFESTRAC